MTTKTTAPSLSPDAVVAIRTVAQALTDSAHAWGRKYTPELNALRRSLSTLIESLRDEQGMMADNGFGASSRCYDRADNQIRHLLSLRNALDEARERS